MSAFDKIKNKAEDVLGEAKEKVGEATGNRDLQAEGQKDQASASVKDAGETIKDTFKG